MNHKLTNDFIESILLPYKFHPTASQCDAIRAYISLLLRWNDKISLTTVSDPVEILRFHFGESLFAVSSVPVQHGRLADVGSGAGFPGMALRIGAPELSIALIESNTKKAAFLAETSRELGLSGIQVLAQRMESIGDDLESQDFVVARALGNHASLMRWARRHLLPTGFLVLWLGEDDSDTVARDSAWDWRPPIHIPGSKRRYILYGSLKQ